MDEQTTFEILYENFCRVVRAAISRRTHTDIDEIESIVWCDKVMPNVDRIVAYDCKLSTALYRISTNAALEFIRNRKRLSKKVTALDPSDLDELMPPDEDEYVGMDTELYHRALESLKPEQITFIKRYSKTYKHVYLGGRTPPSKQDCRKACYIRKKLRLKIDRLKAQ